ncbi:hypothetical protein QL093DRAFT_1519793 [Fusarium oxysporum]|nr:hypothetical protein QL093DRAFT_1519793 [Fusarium oxysporum]
MFLASFREFPHHQHIFPFWTTRPLSLVIDVKLNRHVEFHMSNGTSGRCASAPYEVTLWIDTELNQEDTTGVRSPGNKKRDQLVLNSPPHQRFLESSEVISSRLLSLLVLSSRKNCNVFFLREKVVTPSYNRLVSDEKPGASSYNEISPDQS